MNDRINIDFLQILPIESVTENMEKGVWCCNDHI